MPKVTVIIPSYNHAGFLEKRLATVLGQTFQDFHALFLDDASTDDSLAVFARLPKDGRVRAVCNETNSGSPFRQWNKGFALAEGEYVWIAESDDFADPRLLETLVGVLNRNPSVGLAYCQSHLVGVNDVPYGTADEFLGPEVDRRRWEHDFAAPGREECARYLVFQNTIPNASAVVLRRRAFDDACGACDSMRYCGDWMTWVRVLLHCDVAFVAEPLNYFRHAHAGSLTNKATWDGLFLEEEFEVVKFIKERVPIDPADLGRVVERYAARWLTAGTWHGLGDDPARVERLLQLANAISPALPARVLGEALKRLHASGPLLSDAFRRLAGLAFRRGKWLLRSWRNRRPG
jgi:glycosyltransferase involved in cell wall biosynthesis